MGTKKQAAQQQNRGLSLAEAAVLIAVLAAVIASYLLPIFTAEERNGEVF